VRTKYISVSRPVYFVNLNVISATASKLEIEMKQIRFNYPSESENE